MKKSKNFNKKDQSKVKKRRRKEQEPVSKIWENEKQEPSEGLWIQLKSMLNQNNNSQFCEGKLSISALALCFLTFAPKDYFKKMELEGKINLSIDAYDMSAQKMFAISNQQWAPEQ